MTWFKCPPGCPPEPSETRCRVSQEYLSAYSTPVQEGTEGSPMIFDINALQYGDALFHREESGQFIVQEPGYYYVDFHGTLAPTSSSTIPLALSVYLRQNSIAVPGTAVYHTFQATGETSNLAFSQIIEITETPTILDVVGSGGNYNYAFLSLTIFKLGDIIC